MRHRSLLRAVAYRTDLRFADSQRYRQAVERLARNPDDRLEGALTPEQRLLVHAGAAHARYPSLDTRKYGLLLTKAFNDVRPVCVAPRSDVPTTDLIRAWSQPEAAELWETWWHPGIRQANTAAYEGTKAAMVTMAGLKRGPHFLAGRDALSESPRLLEFFAELARQIGRARPSTAPLVLREYSSCTRHLSRLSENFPELAMETGTRIVRALAEIHPNAPIGKYLVVDGTAVPAWCRQASAKRNGVVDELVEARYRKRVPEADYRAIGYDHDGQFNPETETGRKSRQLTKAWRGYTLVLGSDLVTGLPIVGSLHGAAIHEPHSAKVLMERLHQSWPEIPLQAVVADALWDDDPTNEFFETRYGVHLVARRRPSHKQSVKHFHPERGGYRGGIARIAGDGTAYCRAHNQPLIFEGTAVPSRAHMAPGEPSSTLDMEAHGRRFRSRFRCADGCGRPSLPTNLAWSALPYYPLNPVGRPDLYAMRTALLGQRNLSESAFASLEVAYKQGMTGGCRTRVFDREVYEALIWISLLTRSLLTLADQRDARSNSLERAG